MIRETINEAIARTGISNSELHRLTGISRASISRFRAGKASLSVRNLDKIIKVLNISL